MKKVLGGLIFFFLIIITSCNFQAEQDKYQRHTANFLGTFDTVVQVIGYTSTEEEFLEYVDHIHQRFHDFHRLYDKYNDYDGINNIKTINDFAGIKPVQVEQEIIDLILFSIAWHERTHGKVNIAIGNLLDIWDETMKQALENSNQAHLPALEELQASVKHVNINNVVVDKAAMTVFLTHKDMSLDVGAIGKGFAAEIIGREVMEKGFTSGVIISGGNWKILGKPQRTDRDYWMAGIQDPDKPYALDEEGILEKVLIENKSLDTSGDYLRYALIEGMRVHHIIDPDTLKPGEYHRGVTVLADDSGVADILSTGLFLLPYEKGRQLVDSLDGVEALWILQDKTIIVTDGMQETINGSQ